MAAVQGTGVGAVFSREIKRLITDPIYLVIMMGLPLFSFALLIVMFYAGVPRNIPVAVYDSDNSALSRRITRLIDATPSMEVTHKVSDFEQGRNVVLTGTCDALIVLPRNLEHDVLKGLAPPVINYYDNLYLLPASLISRDVHRVVGTVSAGISMRLYAARGVMTREAKKIVEPVKAITRVLFNPYTNYIYFLVGSLLPTMLQIFIIMSAVYCFGDELKRGTARDWLEHAGGSTWKAVLGKTLPSTLVFFVIGLFMNTLLFNFLAAPLKGSAFLIGLALLFFIAAYQAIGLFMVTVSANMRLSLSGAAFFSSTAFCFVGITFPIYAMPLSAQVWAGILPLNYYLKIYIDQSMRAAPPIHSLVYLGALLAFVLLFVVCLPRLHKLMLDESYWRRI